MSQKVNEAEFFDNFKKSGNEKSVVRTGNDVKFIYEEEIAYRPHRRKLPFNLKVYSVITKCLDYAAKPFWWLYDGITDVLWCGELNRLYDELASVRKERDDAIFRADMLDALLKVQKERAASEKVEKAEADDELNPWADFRPPPKPVKKPLKSSRKKSARRR